MCYTDHFAELGLSVPASKDDLENAWYQVPQEDRAWDKSGVVGDPADGGWEEAPPKAVVVTWRTTAARAKLFHETEAFVAKWDAWFDTKMAAGGVPASIASGANFWHAAWGSLEFYSMQLEVSKGAYSSMALSLGLAFVVLLAATRNPLLTLYAVLTIFLILATVVGVLILDGWELNVTESVVLAIAVGMSIDFVVHFAHSFCHAAGAVEARVTTALTEMGISVTAGAFTTLVAGIWLLMSSVLFYFKFGTFLALVMTVAWLFSVGFFMPLLRVGGALAEKTQFGGKAAEERGGGAEPPDRAAKDPAAAMAPKEAGNLPASQALAEC